MITLESAATFFGWCSVISLAVLLISTIFIIVLKDFAVRTHSKMFGIDPAVLPMAYFEYLGNYKIAFYIFSLVPYIALKIMT